MIRPVAVVPARCGVSSGDEADARSPRLLAAEHPRQGAEAVIPSGMVPGGLEAGAEMALMQSAAIEVRLVRGKGRGVFARRPIEAGETIERVPVIVLPAEQVGDDPDLNPLVGYIFAWGRG